MTTIYLNGTFLPPEQAMVSVMDRGYLFGDGVYEVIPVYNGKAFRLDAHLKRLHNSLEAIRIREPMSVAEWRAMIEGLLQRNPGADQYVYLQVTRGVAPKRDHAFDDSLVPAVFAMVNPIAPADPAVARDGIKAITLDDIRWHACNIKAITLLPNVLLRQQAIDAGAAEAILHPQRLRHRGRSQQSVRRQTRPADHATERPAITAGHHPRRYSGIGRA